MPDDKTTKRKNEQKDSNKYVEGAANSKKTKADLDAIAFKNAQAKKLLELQKKKKNTTDNTNNTKKKNRKTSSAGRLTFGNTVLGQRRRNQRRKKKNNRLT